MAEIVIIGSGMAGMVAADRLIRAGRKVVVYDAKPHWGGHTYSLSENGFVFDEGPHVSFTKNEEVQKFFAKGAGLVEVLEAAITNAFRGHWVRHPAQCHLYGLDPQLVARCIADFVVAQNKTSQIRNYADWCIQNFGRTFAENFPFAYTRKYWTVDPSRMSTDWISKRIYPPKLEEMIQGALTPNHKGDFHYLQQCRYPRQGGYQSFMKAMYHPEVLRLNCRLKKLDLKEKVLQFSNDQTTHYDELVLTMPLPEIIRAIPISQVPVSVRKASGKLLCSSLVLVDIAVNRPDLFDHHWFYVYDEDFLASRVHFPHLFSSQNAPAGKGSIQVEVYHSRYRPLPCSLESLEERVVQEMIRLKILSSAREVLWTRRREVPYANVVYEKNRSRALKTILPWIKKKGIHLAGRYGEWGYHWTDDATISGWKAAESILKRGKR